MGAKTVQHSRTQRIQPKDKFLSYGALIDFFVGQEVVTLHSFNDGSGYSCTYRKDNNAGKHEGFLYGRFCPCENGLLWRCTGKAERDKYYCDGKITLTTQADLDT
jgi:hypothetical protein